jgi:pimeloyl-ACP methyl ester carboxylesterase
MIGLLMLMGVALLLLIILLTTILVRDMVLPPRHTLAWALARGIPVDPGELGLPFDQWMLERPDGARLAVWEIEGRGQPGLSAVFLHGWGKSRITSLQRIAPFVPLVDRIVLYDLRGHGESTGGASRLGDGEDDDLLALLETSVGQGRFLLIGHSMGAVIALRAAMKAQDRPSGHEDRQPLGHRIAGIIAYAPYCEFHRSLQGRLRTHGLLARPITDVALMVHRMRGLRPPSLDDMALRTLDIPALVIHGSNDTVVPFDHARRVAGALRRATLLEIAGASHSDVQDQQTTEHRAALRQFVADLTSCEAGWAP